jgi:hypothetical protein
VKLSTIHDAVDRYIAELALYAIALMLFFGGLFSYFESTQLLKFHTWLYFITVTISSVGYGDITVKTIFGRLTAMCLIATAIISVPKITNELIEKMSLQSVYMRAVYHPKSRNSKHIVICGDLTSTSLKDFSNELFHEDHENDDLCAAMLIPSAPTVEIIFLMRDPRFFLSLTYLQGSALLETDLQRARAEKATAIFIMTNKFSSNPDEEDSKSILLNLSIKRYLSAYYRRNMLYCLQLIRPENRKHLSMDDCGYDVKESDLVVCLNEIKMGTMAKAVLYPGANTLLMNLLTSFADDPIEVEEDEEDQTQIGTSSGKVMITSKAWVE